MNQMQCPFHSRATNAAIEPLAHKAAITPTRATLCAIDPSSIYKQEDLDQVKAFFAGIDIDIHLLVPNIFFNQITAPSVSETLLKTGQMERNLPERYQRTAHFLLELPKDPASKEAQKIIHSVNAMHAAAGVDPNSADFHYVMYCFTSKLVEMLKVYDHTPPTEAQELAWYNVWKGICSQMNCTNLPEDYQEFKKQNQEFESKARASISPETKQFAQHMFSEIMSRFPDPAIDLAKDFVVALLDDELPELLGLEPPSSAKKSLLRHVLLISSDFEYHRKAMLAWLKHEKTE